MFELSLIALLVSILSLSAYIAFHIRTAVGFFLLFYCGRLLILPAFGKVDDLSTYLGPLFPTTVYEQVNWFIALFFAAALLGGLAAEKTIKPRPFPLLGRITIGQIRLSLLFFLGVSYFANTIIYDTPSYFIASSDINRFNSMMSQTNGTWFLVVMASLGTIPAVLYVGFHLSKRPLTIAAVLKAIATVVVTYIVTFPATRTGMLTFFVAFAVILYDNAPTLSGRLRMIVFAIPLALAAMAVSQILNMQRQGLEITAPLEATTVTAESTDFLQYDNAAFLVDGLDAMEPTNFGFLAATLSPINLIPSAFVPFEKPRADKDAYLTESIFGGALDLRFYTAGSTVTFSMPITSTMDFGALGVVISGLAFGFLLVALTLFSKYSAPPSQFFLIFYSIITIASIRFSLEGLALQLQIFTIVVLIMRFMPTLGAPRQRTDARMLR